MFVMIVSILRVRCKKIDTTGGYAHYRDKRARAARNLCLSKLAPCGGSRYYCASICSVSMFVLWRVGFVLWRSIAKMSFIWRTDLFTHHVCPLES